jgi:predicted dehydrogenase
LTAYRAAVIGCGRTASLLEDDPLRAKPCTHMGHYRKSRRIRVVAGSDINAERRTVFKRRWRVGKTYEDYREMLEIALAFHESFRAEGAKIELPLLKSALKIDSR